MIELTLSTALPMTEPKDGNKLEWMRPDQVMQLYRMKLKKRALQARINTINVNRNNDQHVVKDPKESNSMPINGNISQPQKRKNPFMINETNKKPTNVPSLQHTGLQISNEETLFELLKINQEEKNITGPSESNPLSFSNVLSSVNLKSTNQTPDVNIPKGTSYIPMDWTLKTKMRLMSLKPFPWNSTLKTSEQASGTTGFVRCLNIGEKETTLDTTPNARSVSLMGLVILSVSLFFLFFLPINYFSIRFHQCCLIWQHPSLSWLELFPRSAGKVSASLASNMGIANSPSVKDALNTDWCSSFRSLFHLLRVRQCPYFYVCANAFTVLFRAAGICGIPEIHALVTPTTRGFRQSLKQEGKEFLLIR